MKKLLLFLLLFGSGIALLFWLDEDARGRESGVETSSRSRDRVPQAKDAPSGIAYSGVFEGNVYDDTSGRALLFIRSEDSASLGSIDQLTDVTVDLLAPGENENAEPGSRQATTGRVQAERASIERLEGGDVLKPVYTRELLLEVVKADFPELLGLTDVRFESPSMILDAQSPDGLELRSDDPVSIRSTELEGDGLGVLISMPRSADRLEGAPGSLPARADSQLVEFRREGRLEFLYPLKEDQEGSTSDETLFARAEVSATGDGPLQLTSRGAGPERVITLEGWRGVHMSLHGRESSELDADHLRARAQSQEETRALRPREIDADGNVLWNYGGSRFAGEKGRIEFDREGEFERAILTEFPSAHLNIQLDLEKLEGDQGTGTEEGEILVSSDTLIELRRVGDRLLFSVAGPATVENERFRLRSNGELTGFLPLEPGGLGLRDGVISLSGQGGVVVELLSATPEKTARLETGALDLTIYPGSARDTPARLHLVTARGARFAGQLEDGRAFSVTTPDSLELERIGDHVRILRAKAVDLSVGDPASTSEEERHYRAVCDLLEDYDIENETLTARGNVVVTGDVGTLTGDVLRQTGPAAFEVWGNSSKQAVVSSSFARVDADYLKADASFILAKGNVSASITGLPERVEGLEELALERYDVTCDDLEIRHLETEFERIFQVKAAGDVWSELAADERFVELHHADSLFVDRTDRFAENTKRGRPLASHTEALAVGDVRTDVSLASGTVQLACHELRIDRTLPEGAERAIQEIHADRKVLFDGVWVRPAKEEDGEPKADATLSKGAREIRFDGEADSLRFDPDGSVHLEGEERGHIVLRGALPIRGHSFELNAKRAVFSANELDAVDPEIVILPLGYRASGKELSAHADGLQLTGNARLRGSAKAPAPWELNAGLIQLLASNMPGRKSAQRLSLSEVSATGDVSFSLGDIVSAYGQVLRKDALGIRLEGTPASIRTKFATTKSEWIEFDPDLKLITGTGRSRFVPPQVGDGGPGGAIRSGSGGEHAPQAAQQQDEAAWTLDVLSSKTEIDQDQLVFYFEAPTFVHGPSRARLEASWAVVWIDRARWSGLTDEERSLVGKRSGAGDGEAESAVKSLGPMQVFFHFLEAQGISELVNEAYFEGPVQVFSNEALVARADAVYFDLASRHGWLANATVSVLGSLVAKKIERLIVHADWLRHSADGSLRADDATITPCDYDIPHVRIVTGDLRLTPLEPAEDESEKAGYQISVRDNRIELFDLLTIPLPPIGVDTDEDLRPSLPTIRFGNSARFGSLFSFRFTRQAKRLGSFFHSFFSGSEDDEPAEGGVGIGSDEQRPKKDYDARYDFDASYLGSRGGLLDLGFSIRSKERYWFELVSGIAVDNGRDRGYIRVPEDERDSLRLWLHGQGRFQLSTGELRFSYSDQSDPAVISEFYESDFVRYEQDESYLQWKLSDGNLWAQASAKLRVDEFRAEVEELPSVTGFRGRAPLFTLGSHQVIHTGDLQAAYLRRRTPSLFDVDQNGVNETALTSPFGLDGNFPDGATSQEVLRVDTTQTLEFPIALGTLGLQFTPFLRVRGTFWDDAVADNQATRLATEVGARVSTLFWKDVDAERHHLIAPFIEYKNGVSHQTAGTPYLFDRTEAAVFGNFIQLGARSRFGVTEDRSLLDLDVKGTFASDRSDGRRDGWLPLELFGHLGVEPGGHRFDIWYDGRLDVERGETVYSLFSLGTRVTDRLGVQAGYHYGRDSNNIKLFDAASLSGFYRWTNKWEFEGRQVFSLLEKQDLGFSLILRRYGHDLVFEIESDVREGEGSSISFSVKPTLDFKPNRIGYIHW